MQVSTSFRTASMTIPSHFLTHVFVPILLGLQQLQEPGIAESSTNLVVKSLLLRSNLFQTGDHGFSIPRRRLGSDWTDHQEPQIKPNRKVGTDLD